MLDAIIAVFFITGLTFLVTQSDGPFGSIGWARNRLISNRYVGVFFFHLFSCPFCTGCYSGAIGYLLHEKSYTLSGFCLWFLAGGAISLTMEKLYGKLDS